MYTRMFSIISPIVDEECDVVIVGGGLSGLVAAIALAQADANMRVIIVEANEHFGGHLISRGGDELGAKWILAKHHEEIINLLDENHVDLRTPAAVDQLGAFHTNKVNRLKSISGFELSRFINEIDVICRDYVPNTRYKRWTCTMGDYIVDRLFMQESRNYISFLVRAYAGVEAANLYVHEFLSMCYTCYNFSKLIDSLMGAPNCQQPNLPWSSVIEKLEAQLPSNFARWRRQKVVNVINLDARNVIVRTSENKLLKSKVVIMAIPWQSVKGIKFSPPLWPTVYERVKKQDSFTIMFKVVYKNSVWQENGTALDYKSRMYYFEWEPCTLSGAVFCNSFDEIPMDPRDFILCVLVKKFGFDMLFPIRFEHVLLPQAELINFPDTDTHDMMIWASTNNAIAWRGFLSGAVQAALQASVLALTILRPSLVSINHLRILGFRKCMHKRPSTTIVQRYLLSLNVISVVRATKVVGFGFCIYYIWRMFLKGRIKI